MPRHRARLGGWVLACSVSCVCWVGLVFAAETAFADPAPEFTVPIDLASEPALPAYESCPEPLPSEPSESEDAAAVQVYELRREARVVCVAQIERLDQVVARQWWIVSQLLGEQAVSREVAERLERLEAGAEERNELLREINAAYSPGPLKTELTGIDSENPLPVAGIGAGGGSPEETEELVASIDAGAEGTMVGLYFIGGLVVALFIGGALQRTVDRAT